VGSLEDTNRRSYKGLGRFAGRTRGAPTVARWTRAGVASMLYFRVGFQFKEMRMFSLRSSIAILPLLLLPLMGCSESTSFEQIQQREAFIADFDNLFIQGGERFEMTTSVPGDIVHPEFDARWTNLNREVSIEFYVLRAEDYDPSLRPSELKNLLWPQGELRLGESRPSKIILHPEPGQWVLFFYNPADRSLANRVELSSQIKLTFFR
jgi:hypothetical protein